MQCRMRNTDAQLPEVEVVNQLETEIRPPDGAQLPEVEVVNQLETEIRPSDGAQLPEVEVVNQLETEIRPSDGAQLPEVEVVNQLETEIRPPDGAQLPEVEVVNQLETEIRPPDGGWGWVVCLACFLTNCTIPGSNSINGIILIELLDLFNDSLSKTTIVCSIISSTAMFGGPLVSIALMFKASHRQIMMVGGIIAAASAVASSFAPNVETLIFTYGILVGFSLSVNYFAANVTLGQYFLKRRALALGIANSGMGFGSFAMNYLSTKVIPFYGMRGTFLLLGGLFLNLTVYGALCRPLKPVNKQRNKYCTSVDELEGAANLGFEAEGESKETEDERCDDSNRRISEDITPLPKTLQARQSITSEIVPSELYNRKSSDYNATMFKNKYFYLLLAIYTTHSVGNSVQIYLPVYVVSVGLSREESALIMAIYGAIGIVSVLLVGFLADIIHIPISYLLMAAMSSMSLGAILVPFCQSFETLALCAIMTSIGHHFGISLRIVLISAILGTDNMTAAYSILSGLIGVLYFLYPTIKGFVSEATQQFSVVFYFDSVIVFLGAVLSCGIIYAQKTGKFVE